MVVVTAMTVGPTRTRRMHRSSTRLMGRITVDSARTDMILIRPPIPMAGTVPPTAQTAFAIPTVQAAGTGISQFMFIQEGSACDD